MKSKITIQYDSEETVSARINKKRMEKRAKRIQNIFQSIPKRASLTLLDTPDKLPLIQLWGASQQFSFGWYESSILNASFAAEYAILIRLDESLTIEQKNNIAQRGLSFSASIGKALKMSLINQEIAKELTVLCNLRNMTAHPSNWVTLYKQLDQACFPNNESVKNWIEDITKKSTEELIGAMGQSLDSYQLNVALERLEAFKVKQWGGLPNLEWAAHKATLREQEAIVKTYSEKMVKDFLVDRKILTIIEKPQDAAKYIQRNYPYPEELAFMSLQTAFNTIKTLRFIN